MVGKSPPFSFPQGGSIRLSLTRNSVKYHFYDENGTVTRTLEGGTPDTITDRSSIGIELKHCIDPNDDYKSPKLREKLQETLIALHKIYIILKEETLVSIEEAKRKAEEEEKKQLRSAELFLQLCPNPFQWITSNVAWLTAGEKANIMLGFTAYASQIILKTPISVIILGEGSSGKTHIQSTALRLLPQEYVLYEKSITEAAMFRRAEMDPFFYDMKVVNYGDMGGINSQSDVVNAKDMLKELQSDGYVSKPLTVPSAEGGWIVKDMVLRGYPALTYTSVPGHEFDDQELSRSIFITPRLDNREVFMQRLRILHSGGKTRYKVKQVLNTLNRVPFLLRALHGRYDDVMIINPYHKIIEDVLGSSEYYKRDWDKYLGILNTVTALNGINRDVHEFYGVKYLFTTFDDVKLFIDLLERYRRSIAENLTPEAAKVYQTIKENLPSWTYESLLIRDKKLTITEYMELSGTTLRRRSVNNYFRELENSGLLKTVGNRGRANIYALTTALEEEDNKIDYTWSDRDRELFEDELCSEAVDIILKDKPTPGLSLNNVVGGVGVPPWEKYDRH